MDVLVIGIAGGTGSGKTTVARRIIDQVGAERIASIEQDSFYKDLSHIASDKRAKHNFDHPSALDFNLFKEQVKTLKEGKIVKKPIYDFVTHTRIKETIAVEPRQVLIVEGILIFDNKELRDLLDIKIFVETPSDIRFIRRLMRDINVRGRDIESVVKQYYSTVRPMHLAFVEPSREHSDVIVPWHDYNSVAIEMVISRIRERLSKIGDGL